MHALENSGKRRIGLLFSVHAALFVLNAAGAFLFNFYAVKTALYVQYALFLLLYVATFQVSRSSYHSPVITDAPRHARLAFKTLAWLALIACVGSIFHINQQPPNVTLKELTQSAAIYGLVILLSQDIRHLAFKSRQG